VKVTPLRNYSGVLTLTDRELKFKGLEELDEVP
jgi:hypothetical protein